MTTLGECHKIRFEWRVESVRKKEKKGSEAKNFWQRWQWHGLQGVPSSAQLHPPLPFATSMATLISARRTCVRRRRQLSGVGYLVPKSVRVINKNPWKECGECKVKKRHKAWRKFASINDKTIRSCQCNKCQASMLHQTDEEGSLLEEPSAFACRAQMFHN